MHAQREWCSCDADLQGVEALGSVVVVTPKSLTLLPAVAILSVPRLAMVPLPLASLLVVAFRAACPLEFVPVASILCSVVVVVPLLALALLASLSSQLSWLASLLAVAVAVVAEVCYLRSVIVATNQHLRVAVVLLAVALRAARQKLFAEALRAPRLLS
jgi:hypothetical protein